jgi:hypothetical protein
MLCPPQPRVTEALRKSFEFFYQTACHASPHP